MKNIEILIFLCVAFFLINCKKSKPEDEIIGMYVSQNTVNVIDTVRILANGTYINLMYRKADNTLIYKNVDEWNFYKPDSWQEKHMAGYIEFNDFFGDVDDVHSKEQGNFEDVLMTMRLPLEYHSGTIIIRHKPSYDEKYLKKVK